VRPDFQVTNQNAAAVAELCVRLEGIPLAIELAAAQAKVLTPAQMLGQLEQRLAFLVSRRRDAATRHRTLREAIDWSYQLLSPELQRFFARLSVFRGGWTVEAAEAVCEEVGALTRLIQLRECSLIMAEETPAGMRFGMLETLREFADEHLGAEEKAELQRRHAEYFLELAQEATPQIGPFSDEGGREQWLARLDEEMDNLRAALFWALARDPSLALRLSKELRWFWAPRGHVNEARSILKVVLEHAPDTLVELKAEVLGAAAGFEWGQRGHGEYHQLMEESLRLYRQCGYRQAVADRLRNLGFWARVTGDLHRSRALFEESLSIYQELDDQGSMAFALGELGRYEEGLQILRQAGDQYRLAGWLNNMAIGIADKGEYGKARVMLEESLAIRRELGWGIQYPLIHLAHVASCEGSYAEARRLLTEALYICRRVVDMWLIWECLEGLAEVEVGEKQYERAAHLHGAAMAVRERMGLMEFTHHQRQFAEVEAAVGKPALAAAVQAGRALTWQQAVALALEE
jgi:tetratricopeptide (TPR) repeat protein